MLFSTNDGDFVGKIEKQDTYTDFVMVRYERGTLKVFMQNVLAIPNAELNPPLKEALLKSGMYIDTYNDRLARKILKKTKYLSNKEGTILSYNPRQGTVVIEQFLSYDSADIQTVSIMDIHEFSMNPEAPSMTIDNSKQFLNDALASGMVQQGDKMVRVSSVANTRRGLVGDPDRPLYNNPGPPNEPQTSAQEESQTGSPESPDESPERINVTMPYNWDAEKPRYEKEIVVVSIFLVCLLFID